MHSKNTKSVPPIPMPGPSAPFSIGTLVACDLPLRGTVHGTVCGESRWSMIHVSLLNGDLVNVHIGSLRRVDEIPTDSLACFVMNYHLATGAPR